MVAFAGERVLELEAPIRNEGTKSTLAVWGRTQEEVEAGRRSLEPAMVRDCFEYLFSKVTAGTQEREEDVLPAFFLANLSSAVDWAVFYRNIFYEKKNARRKKKFGLMGQDRSSIYVRVIFFLQCRPSRSFFFFTAYFRSKNNLEQHHSSERVHAVFILICQRKHYIETVGIDPALSARLVRLLHAVWK